MIKKINKLEIDKLSEIKPDGKWIIDENFKWPKGTTEEMKEYFKRYIEHEAEMRCSVSVVYKPSCGCDVAVDFVLDRYPMSKKIHSTCPICEKGVLMEISDPIRFYTKVNDYEWGLEEMKDCVISDTWQSEYLHMYKCVSLLYCKTEMPNKPCE